MLEREAKFIVDDAFELPDLGGAVRDATTAAPEERQIRDTYFDTVDLRLARWGCTLRHRNSEGWTVKLPVDTNGVALTRDEVRFPGDPGDPPAAALALVASLTRGSDVAVVARIANRRLARTWRDVDGATVIEITDDAVHAQTPGARNSQFREIEVELAPGAGLSQLRRTVDVLEDAGARGADPMPKLVRALGGAAAAAPDVTVPALGDSPTARDVIHAAIARSVTQLLLNVPAAQLGEDPEGVHQARVATRRLRSDLRTFGPLLDRTWATGLRRELAWLADELGTVRDADVLLARLGEAIDRSPTIDGAAAARVLERLVAQRTRDRARLLQHLGDRRARQLYDHLVVAAADPQIRRKATGPAPDRLAPLVRRRWRQLRRAVDALGPHPESAELHRVRILAKRTRYAADAVSPAFGKKARRFAKSVARIQDVLGDLNDIAVAEVWLAGAADELDGEAAFAAGRLVEVLTRDAVRHRDDWERSYRKASRSSLRSWFD